MTSLSDVEAQPAKTPQALLDAEAAIQRGDRQRAYQLSREATQSAPENVETWLLCAETTSSVEEAIACLNRANALQPSSPQAKQKTYQIVQKLLQQDPFLLYVGEDEGLYRVRSGEKLDLILPKERSTPEPYPAEKPAWLRTAQRWLWVALFGLPLAGLGALLFAPLAAVYAIGLYLKTPSDANRVHSLLVIMLAGCLWLCGLLLGVILLVHVI